MIAIAKKFPRTLRCMGRGIVIIALLCMMQFAYSGPGAHGPNGEHLDAPAGQAHSHSATQTPRLETFSESFELVATLGQDELSILIDHYETNKPVLHGKVEVEAEGIKATGQFHADHGDYSVTDSRLLKALSQPGRHALVFTVFTANESDLLEGTLNVAAQANQLAQSTESSNEEAGGGMGGNASLIGLGVFFLAAVLVFLNTRRARTASHNANETKRNSQ